MKITIYNELNEIQKKLIDTAKRARENAYAPFSNYKVGASVLSSSGKIYSGCNIESAVYTLTTHAEVLAIDKMVSDGETKLKKLAVLVQCKEPGAPCGICRQKINEFADEDAEILGAVLDNDIIYIFTLSELLPVAFTSERLKDGQKRFSFKQGNKP